MTEDRKERIDKIVKDLRWNESNNNNDPIAVANGRKVRKVSEMHGSEIIADYWSFKIMPQLATIVGGDHTQAELVKSALSFYCDQPLDEGIHPRGEFRIGMGLRNPELNKQLRKDFWGTDANKAWCEVSDLKK